MKHKYIAFLLVIICTIHLGYSQIPENVKKEIQYRVTNKINPSIAVGVLDSAGTHYYVHGYKDVANKVKADENTLYEIGSITKTFTGLLLAKFNVTDSLDLKTPANNLLPDSIKLTDKKGNNVTLKSLSTHSSGLPRLPNNLDLQNQLDPYASYTRNDMYSFLSHYIPKTVDKNFEYSNLGAGLLGELLATYKKDSYKNLLQKNILTPLALNNTFLKVPEAQTSNYAKGYIGNNEVPHWTFKAMAPAGGLKASIKDLLKYGKSYLNPENPLAKAQKVATTTQFTDQEMQKHGLGWFINNEQVIFHGGGTGGFRTFLAVDKKNKRVIAVMTNSGSSPAEDIAEHLIDPKKKPLDTAHKVVDISAEELIAYEGNYLNDGLGLSYDFIALENTLQAQLSGQPEFPVYYQGESTFFYKVVKAKIVFERDENNTVVGLTLYQNGQEIPFIKTTP
ncbi:serine hydrolase domain-containing protein [Joostella sp. CR20]|uniref:serine hydrolase domain-containing protein n=1 Tax=Joostella sp. CR20 TaxID=2804312 RepID=UPI00313D5262